MAPGRFRLAPSRYLATTTVTWVRRNLPAAGKTYTFRVSPSGAAFGKSWFVKGTKATAVVETWSAGD